MFIQLGVLSRLGVWRLPSLKPNPDEHRIQPIEALQLVFGKQHAFERFFQQGLIQGGTLP